MLLDFMDVEISNEQLEILRFFSLNYLNLFFFIIWTLGFNGLFPFSHVHFHGIRNGADNVVILVRVKLNSKSNSIFLELNHSAGWLRFVFLEGLHLFDGYQLCDGVAALKIGLFKDDDLALLVQYEHTLEYLSWSDQTNRKCLHCWVWE